MKRVAAILSLCLASLIGCVKGSTLPASTVASSNLRSSFSITTSGGFVFCNASFVDVSTGNYNIMLESDAIVTCNQTPMSFSGSTYYTSVGLPIVAGTMYRVYVTRPSLNATIVSDPLSF